MQPDLKHSARGFGLLLLNCLLLLAGLLSWQQSTRTAHAAFVVPSFDLVLYTSANTVWGHNGFPGTELDDNNIGVTNNSGATSGFFGSLSFVFARGTDIYEQRGRFLFQLLWSPNGCVTATQWCLVELDDNPNTTIAAAGGNGQFYQAHSSGTIWQLNGICFHCWTQISGTNMGGFITAGDGKLAALGFDDQTAWKYNGTPFSWTTIDQTPDVDMLKADPNGTFFEDRDTGVVQGLSAFHWTPILTDNTDANLIIAGKRTYVQTFNITNSTTSLFIYNENFSNPAWTVLPSLPPPSSIIVAPQPGTVSDALYLVLSDGSVWQYTPESGFWQEFSPPVAPQGVFLAYPDNR